MRTFTRISAILTLLISPFLLTGCTQGSSGQLANTTTAVTFTVDGSAKNGDYEGIVKDATGRTQLNVIFGEGETMINKVKLPTNSARELKIVIRQQQSGGRTTEVCEFKLASVQNPITAHYDGKTCSISDS